MFCSNSVTEHLLRGVAAIALIAFALTLGASHLLIAALALIGACVLLRGCPMCWITGLFQTMVRRRSAQTSEQEA